MSHCENNASMFATASLNCFTSILFQQNGSNSLLHLFEKPHGIIAAFCNVIYIYDMMSTKHGKIFSLILKHKLVRGSVDFKMF